MSEIPERPAAHPDNGESMEMNRGQITHHIGFYGVGCCEMSKEAIRASIYEAEALMASSETVPLIPAEHMFVPGLYFRRFEMAEGTFLTGKLHARDDGLIVASGKVTFCTENGNMTIEGPCMTTVKANTKPLLYAHTHVVFFSAHSNSDDTQDIAVIESRIITPNAIGCQNQEVLR